jgi:HlyD family secretion protein
MHQQDQQEVIDPPSRPGSRKGDSAQEGLSARGGAIRTNLKLAFKILLAGLAVATIIYCVRFRPIDVQAYKVVRGEVVAEVMGTGTLEAHTSASVGSKIPGRIVEIRADQNDRVRKDQVLAVLDDSELKSQVEVAISALQTAQATLARVKTDKARAEAVLELAHINHERAAKLQSQSAAAQLEVDTSSEQLKVAQADLERSTAAIAEAEHQVVTAQNTLRYQKTLLDNTIISSPFDGLIVRRDHVVGDVIAAGTCIFQIVSTDELWASVWVDETSMAALKPGQAARIIFRSLPGKEYPGAVVRLGREVDRQTREFLVDIQVQDLPANWAVGQRVDAFVATDRKENVLALPYRMLAWKAGKPGV